ncbi:MAG: VWA domain-containing protein [Deltaproteobacteria bacterium]|nr:MAG: VWA domain-containing protein [Deltaproteobacteria bacterium]
MTIERTDRAREKGMALVYVGIFLVPLLLCTGLAVDMGRGYLVRATLAKAVDAAALAAARNMTADSSQAQRAGNNIFNANFPAGYLGVSPDPPQIDTDGRGSDGSYIIKVSSKATMPTTFMRIANFETLTVAANAQATRRLVDMSFVIDRSGSLKGKFPQVKQAAKQFMSYFDPTSESIALRPGLDRQPHRQRDLRRRNFDGRRPLSGLGSAPYRPAGEPIRAAHRGPVHGRLTQLLHREVPGERVQDQRHVQPEAGEPYRHHRDVRLSPRRRERFHAGRSRRPWSLCHGRDERHGKRLADECLRHQGREHEPMLRVRAEQDLADSEQVHPLSAGKESPRGTEWQGGRVPPLCSRPALADQ